MAVRLAVIGLIVATATTAHGQTVTNWTGTGGLTNTWSTGTNWATGVAPTSSIDTSLTFGITTGTTTLNMDIGSQFNLNRLTFTTDINGTGVPSSYTFTGGELLFSASTTSVAPELVYGGANATATVTQTIGNAIRFNSNLMTFRVDGSNSNALRLNGTITADFAGSTVLTLTGTSTNTRNVIGGNITETNGASLQLVKAGAGRWEQAAGVTGSFSGGVNMTAGTLVLGGNNVIANGINQAAGTMVLSGSNTISGTVNVLSGTLRMQNVNGFDGITSLTLGNAATIGNLSYSLAANSTAAHNIIIGASSAGGGALIANDSGVATATVTFNGTITNNAAAGTHTLYLGGGNTGVNVLASTLTNGVAGAFLSVVKNGASVWELTGNNTFTGGVTITNGMLRAVSITNNLNSVNNVLRFNTASGTNGVIETSGVITNSLGTSTGSIAWAASGGFSAVGGTLGVNLNGGAALTWNSGSFTTTGNELQFNSINADNVVTFTNAIALGTTTRAIRVTDNTNSTADYAIIAGVISGGSTTGGVIKTGSGLLELAGANTFSGGISINGGTVRGDATTGLRILAGTNPNFVRFSTAANGGGVIETSGTLTNALGTAAGQIAWRGVGAINATTGASGGFSAFGGALNVTLNADNTTPLVWDSTANFTATNGEIAFGSILANDVVTFNNPINLNDQIRTIRIYDNTTTTADYAVMTGTLSSTTPASGGLIKAGAGTLVLTADATYSNTTTVSGGTLRLGNGGTSGNLIGNIRLTNSTTANPINLVFHHSAIVPVAGVISGNGAVTITGASTGGVLFNAANTYTGTTTLAAGTLRLGAAGNVLGNLYLNAGTTLDLNGQSLGLAGLIDDTTGPGYVINPGANAVLTLSGGSFSGTFVESPGTIALVKLGANTLTLTGGAANYSGGLTLGGTGTLYVPDGTYLGTGPLTFSGGILETGTTTLNIAAALTLSGNATFTGNTTFTFNSAGMTSVIGAATVNNATSVGPTGVVFEDDFLLGANLTLTGNQDLVMNGNINVTGGARTITVANTGGHTFNNINLAFDGIGNALTLRSATPVTISGAITDGGLGGSVTVTTSSTVTFSNTGNVYGGGTSLTAGTLITPNAGSLGSGTLRLAGGTLQNDAVQTYTNALSLAGAVSLSGSQSLTLAPQSGIINIDANTTLTNAIGVGGVTLTSANTVMNANLTLAAGVAPIILNGTISVSGGTRTVTNNFIGTTTFGAIDLGYDGTDRQLDLRAQGVTSTLNITGAISDATGAGIVRYIGGVMVLNTANTYDGRSDLFARVVINDDAAFGTSPILAAGSSGVIEAAGGTRTLANNITLSANLTLDGASALVLNGDITPTLANRTIFVAGNADKTITGNLTLGDATAARAVVISGTGAGNGLLNLTGTIKDGPVVGGALQIAVTNTNTAVVVSSTNTYTGRTTISGGAVRPTAGFAAAFGLTPVVFNAASGTQAVVETNGTITPLLGASSGSVTWIGAGGFAARGGDLTVILNNDAVTAIPWTAAGLGSSGELQLGSNTADGTVTLSNSIDTSNGQRTIRVFDGSAAVDAIIPGVILATTSTTGGLIKQGPGTLALTGANTFNGGVTLVAGTLKIGNGGTTGSLASQVITSTGSTVWFDRTSNVSQGTLTGTGSVNVTVTGAVLTVTNLNATGLITVSSGTVQVGSGRAAQLNATNIVLNAGTTLRISSTANLSTSADFSGAGQLLISSTGNATGTAVTYLGTSSLTGTITLTGTSNPTFQIGDGATSGSGSISGNMSIVSSSGTIIFNRPDDYTYAGIISSTAAAGAQVRKLSNATLTLSGVSTYTAGTSVAAGTLRVAGALGNTPITVTGGATFEVLAGAGVANTTATVNVMNNGNIIISGTMGAASGTLNANATLRGIGGSTGGTWNIDGGVIEVGGAVSNTISNLTLGGLNFLNAGATLNLDLDAPATDSSSFATLNLSNNDKLVSTGLPTINAASIINLNGNVNTTAGYYLLMSGYSGTIANTSLLTINAPGSFGKQLFNQSGLLFVQLTSVSTLTWAGTVSGGVWDDNSTTNFNGGTVAYNNTARDTVIFDDTATGTTSVNIVGPLQPTAVTVNNSTLTYTFNGNAIGGDTGLSKSGSGLLVLLNDNTFTGGLNITGGVVQIGAGGTVGAVNGTASVAFDTGGTLRVNRSDSYTLGGNISGTGNLEQAGTGTLVLTGNNSYTGATTVSGGTLSIQSTGLMTDLSAITVNSGTFAVNGSVAQVVQNLVVNSGGFAAVNSAALTATNMTVNGGTANIGASNLTAVSLTVDNNGQVNLNGAGVLASSTFRMITGTLNVTSANATLTTVTLGGALSDTTGSPMSAINIASGRTLTLTGGITFTANNNAATDSFGVVINGPGSISTGGAARTWTINDSANAVNDVTITAPISAATSAFSKAGAGTLYLQGTNASTAANTISAGTLVIGNNSALGTGALHMFGGTLMPDGSARSIVNNITLNTTVTISGTQDFTTSGIVTNSGGNRTLQVVNTGTTTFGTLRTSEGATNRTVTIAGTGNLVINLLTENTSTSGNLIVNGTGLRVNLANASVYTGTTSIRNGTVNIGNADSLGGSNTTLIQMGLAATTVTPKLLTTAAISLARNINVIGSGAGSEITLGGASAHLSTFEGDVALGNSVFLTAATSGTVVFNGNLSGAGGLTKVGPGVVLLSPSTANSYAGGTTLAEGILALDNATALGTSASLTIIPASAGANPALVAVGVTVTQGINVSDAVLSNVVIGGSGSTTSTFSGNITFSQDLNLYAGTSGTTYFTGTLDDGGSFVGNVTKTGDGTVILLGTNAWTGLTTINAGILSSTNSLAGTVYVNSGGTFTGYGAAGSTIINQGGSVVYTGNQTGTTVITGGSVDVDSGSNVSGLVSLSGGSVNANSGGTVSGTISVLGGTFNINGGSTISGTIGLNSGIVNVNSGGSYANPTVVNGGTFFVNSGGSVDSTPGIDVNSGGTFNVNTGSVTGNGSITVGGSFVANGTVGGGSVGLVVENGGTLSGSGDIQGSVTVQTGGTVSPGNSVESLNMGNLSLTHGSNLVFEFRDATGSTPGTSWDLIDLGASGVLNLGDATASNKITLYIDSWKLDNSGHGGGVGPDFNNFNPQSSYEWLFIKVNSLANLVTNGNDDDFNRRFNIIDNSPANGGSGVFDTGSGNPFTRPSGSNGMGTFTVAWRTDTQGSGLYIQYSAIPEPGTMLLTGLASLGAGWYGRRRLRRREAQADAANV